MLATAWWFDLDGTLIDSVTGMSLRPHAVELLERLRGQGIPVVLWSAGGDDYAARRADQTGIAYLFDAVYSKLGRDGAGRWLLPQTPERHRPAVFVDDQPDELPALGRAVRVPAYIGPNSRDRALRLLADSLTADRATVDHDNMDGAGR